MRFRKQYREAVLTALAMVLGVLLAIWFMIPKIK